MPHTVDSASRLSAVCTGQVTIAGVCLQAPARICTAGDVPADGASSSLWRMAHLQSFDPCMNKLDRAVCLAAGPADAGQPGVGA